MNLQIAQIKVTKNKYIAGDGPFPLPILLVILRWTMKKMTGVVVDHFCPMMHMAIGQSSPKNILQIGPDF